MSLFVVGYEYGLTDRRLDGLNKNMSSWDVGYYGRVFNAKCREIGMTTIDYPQGKSLFPRSKEIQCSRNIRRIHRPSRPLRPVQRNLRRSPILLDVL